MPSASICSVGRCLAASSGRKGASRPSRRPRTKCPASVLHTTATSWMLISSSLPMRWNTRSAPDRFTNLNFRILGFECLAQPFREWKFHRRVERERTLLVGGLDHERTQRGRLRRGRRERLSKDGTGCQRRRCPEHVASGKLAISHVRSCSDRVFPL